VRIDPDKKLVIQLQILVLNPGEEVAGNDYSYS
jgi:hypothetical protein